MSEKDVVLTYESLFEFLRLEKGREDLQKLQSDFYEQVLNYLCQKQKSFEQKESQQLLFERDDKEKARLELENVKKILKDLYDRREKKILNMALNKSRSGISLINIGAMLPSEQLLYNNINSTLSGFRKDTLFKLVAGELPCNMPNNNQAEPEESTDGPSPTPEAQKPISEDSTLATPTEAPLENPTISPQSEESNGTVHGHFNQSEPEQTKELKTTRFLNESSDNVKKVKFLTPIDEIIGPDLQIYGPFDSGAVKELPKELAAVLIQKQQAEEV